MTLCPSASLRQLFFALSCGAALFGLGQCTAAELTSEDAYIRSGENCWTFGTRSVEQTMRLADGQLQLTSFKNKASDREMLSGPISLLLSDTIGTGPDAAWKLLDARQTKLKQGELQLDLTLARGPLTVTKTFVIYPGSSVIRTWMTLKNTGTAPLKITEPIFLGIVARLGEKPSTLDFNWMVGAHNEPGGWTLKTENLTPGKPRKFDSRDPFPPRGKPSPNDAQMASESYAPWYSFYDQKTKDGLILGWDYMGHWSSYFAVDDHGTISGAVRVAGHKQTLTPGDTLTTPKSFVALYREDLDNAGNELLDWQYRYLWDYTREGWFPAIPMLGYWSKGTHYSEPGVGWVGGKSDIPSQFTKIFRMADLMRYVGGDAYHRDWGWWERAGDWTGPDFGATGRYLRKYGMGQIIYAFLYTVDKKSKVAIEHPDWLNNDNSDTGKMLDMSKAGVVEFILRQLDDFHNRWSDFAWRNDSTPTGPRDGDDTPMLGQDQGFRKVIQSFLDKYPKSSFQSVNGGGNEAGYDYVRLSMILQYSDGAIGLLRNYYTALLFPPDKCEDNGDVWNLTNYDKSTWRGLLACVPVTTGDTWDKAKLEGIRELFDIYHYLASKGVVGRWVKVYRPLVEGDDPTMYFQRMSGDRRRGIIIPARPAKGKVTIRPKGLLPDEKYSVTFQESQTEAQRTGQDLMDLGIVLNPMMPGELIYLNLPLHPGSKRDTEAPTAPSDIVKRPGENMGYPGIELNWKPGTDNNWISYYEIVRDGRPIDKVAKGTFYFDHSAGADQAAKYEVCAVDGSGNKSPLAVATGEEAQRRQVFDDTDSQIKYQGKWDRQRDLQPAHHETLSSSKEKDASLEVAFEGKRVLVFGKLGDDCGKAQISIDGGKPETIDTYCSDDVWGVCLYRKELSTSGKHTLRIVVSGERHPRTKDTWVRIDGIRAEPK